MSEAEVVIYTDGACSPNPGMGGWAAILIVPGKGGSTREISGAKADTTNNRMELTAALEALRALKRSCRVSLYTDSEYLRNAFTQGWLAKWQNNGWRTAAKKPVLNEDLWRALVAEAAKHQVEWKWVRGHASDALNERCDQLAVEARQALAERSQ
jgi:ribonuclease HI